MKYSILCSFFLIIAFNSVKAETSTCEANAAGIVAEMRNSGDYPDMTKREIKIARQAALSACDTTFTKLEADLEEAQKVVKASKGSKEDGIDPSIDPIGWLKEQWHKPPNKKKGIERLKKKR